MATMGSNWQRLRAALKWAGSIFQHISAMLTALAVLALIAHFIVLDWRGAMAQLFNVWNSTVRPQLHYILHVVVETPLQWLGISIVIPNIVRDYVAVGIAINLTFIRAEGGQFWAPFAFLAKPDSIRDSIRALKYPALFAGICIYQLLVRLTAFLTLVIALPLQMLSTYASKAIFPFPPGEIDESHSGQPTATLKENCRLNVLVSRFLTRLILSATLQLGRWLLALLLGVLCTILAWPIALMLLAILIAMSISLWPIMFIVYAFSAGHIGDRLILLLGSMAMRSSDQSTLRENLSKNRHQRWRTAEAVLLPVAYLLIALIVNYLIPLPPPAAP